MGTGFALGLAHPFTRWLSPPLAMSVPFTIPLLTAVGLAGFWLFYRAVGLFERI
jgi:hypothetical protein